jgi:hypothetical protein
MAIVASGAISLGTSAGTDRSISAEFGGTTPHSLSEYYGVAAGVPASGTITMSDFYGTSAGYTVSILDDNNVQSGGDGSAQTVSISWNSDGSITTTANIDGYASTTWINEAPVTGVGSSYEIRATNRTSGLLPAAWTEDVWYAFPKAFTLIAITPGSSKQCTCDFEIRDTATSTTQDTATISLYTARGA